MKLLRLGFLMMVVVLIAGCATTGRTRTETRAVELGDAESARVYIQMGVGELDVGGGAEPLLDGQFIDNLSEWEPDVDYRLEGTQGVLTVVQPSIASGLPVGDVRYEWDLTLNNDVPLALSVDLGAGESNLSLADLSLYELDLEAGVGQATVDLSGAWDNDVQVSLKGGVGAITVLLPSDMGVHARVSGGLGAVSTIGLAQEGDFYVNDVFGTTEGTMNLDIEGGVGEVTLEVVD